MDTLYIHALSPVHAGTGQASAAIVDLPVARERATNWPFIPGTTIKGVCRDEVKEPDLQKKLFGVEDRVIEGKTVPGNAGGLQFGDARLLCLPVRSWVGVFAYVTCPWALKRLQRDSIALGAPTPFANSSSVEVADNAVLLTSSSVVAESGQVWLQDLQLTATESEKAQTIATGIAAAAFPEEEGEGFTRRFVIVSDNVFNFLTETALEITAHIRLKDDTKTVERGALWYVEAVPAEALFTAFIGGVGFPLDNGTVVQLGGDENTGKGLCRLQRGGVQ